MIGAAAPVATQAEGALHLACDRIGAIYVVGEEATFTLTGARGEVSVEVVNYYGEEVIERKEPGAEGKPVKIVISTNELPRLGWHRMTVRAGANSASTTFAMVPPIKDRVPAEDSPFGAIVSTRLTAEEVADFAHSLKLAGVRWVDIDIPLAQINPSDGIYLWDASTVGDSPQNFDAFVHGLHNEGLCLMLKFLGQADWISKRKEKDVHAYWDSELNLSPPSDPKKWAEVVGAVVRQYGEICRTWEVGNEPEGHGYFKGTDDEYMEYLEVTAKAIRAAQPKATVVAASMYNGGGVLPRLVKRPELYDIMSVHYLTGPAGDISPLSHYRKALDGAGVKKVIWNTESRGSGGDEPPKLGEKSHYGTKGATNQSPTKAYVRNFALEIRRVFVFSWNVGEGRQVVNPDLTPRWATVEYRTMADQLEGAKFVPSANLGPDGCGFQFQRGKENILVAWSDVAGSESEIKFASQRNVVTTDIMGNSKEIDVVDGTVTVTVSYAPIFIAGLESEKRPPRIAPPVLAR